MHHRVQLDGLAQSFPCAQDDTILRAALRNGIAFPYECNSGGCGSCMFELVSGQTENLWPLAPGLSATARVHGRQLACQSRPLADCIIRLRLKKNAPAPQVWPSRRAARLVERVELTRDMAEFCFQADAAAEFIPGQYALLSLPGVTGDRAYSMSNLPNPKGLWRFIVKRVPNGRGTAALFDSMHVGDKIMLDGPYGLAHLRSDCSRDIVCIAGGSGISPVLSILSAAAGDTQRSSRKLTLFYGGRTPSDICATALLARDPGMQRRVECVTAVSDATVGAEWSGERGFIHDVVRRRLADTESARQHRYYFCGPPPMTDAVQKLLLLELRVPAAQLHFDRFL